MKNGASIETKAEDGVKKRSTRGVIRSTLQQLNGLTFETMSKTEQTMFVTVLGQLLDVMDETGTIKPLK